ncbi:MAG: phage terminase large subunit, partial [Bacillota bacterium]|nr:phage terminase large subunit [Bacillota bacterium]
HIATRWSRKDPIGRLTDEYAETYNTDFTVINIAALDEHGQSFCDEIKTTEEYLAIRKVTDEFIWEAEFMQRPIESKGLLFPVEELKRFTLDEIRTKKPDGVIGFCDTADSGKDFLSAPIGKRFNEYTYITDVTFTQDGVEITEPLVAEMVIDTKCELLKIESNNGGHSYARNIRKLIQGKSPCSIVDEMNMQNKETRILMNAGYIKEHFYFRTDYEPGSDYDKFMRYLTSYVKLGKNKYDDAPDSLTGLAEYMKLINYTRPEVKKKKDWFFDTEEREEDYLSW